MNKLLQGDCLELIKNIPDDSVDLVVMDPPYEFQGSGGGGAFGTKKRNYHKEYSLLYKETGTTKETERLGLISKGFDIKVLDECCRVLKNINIYIYMV